MVVQFDPHGPPNDRNFGASRRRDADIMRVTITISSGDQHLHSFSRQFESNSAELKKSTNGLGSVRDIELVSQVSAESGPESWIASSGWTRMEAILGAAEAPP